MKYEMFRYKSPDFEELKKYGFKDENGVFKFQTTILDKEFTFFVYVNKSGEVSTHLVDNSLQEEYVLHLNESAVGSFVGKIREEIEKILMDISQKCFFEDVFKSKQAKEVIFYITQTYGDRLEFLWDNSPDVAIWRRKETQKWYGVIFALDKFKLDKVRHEAVDIIDLHLDEEEINALVNGKTCFRAYHMNKKHWMTICLDGGMKSEEIFKLIDESYSLAKK